MILLTGGTGTAGSAISKALVGMGARHRSLVRNRNKAAASAGSDVELVEADLSRPETLDAALKGVEKALLATAPVPMHCNRENFIRSETRGVRHVVKFSCTAPIESAALLAAHGEGKGAGGFGVDLRCCAQRVLSEFLAALGSINGTPSTRRLAR
jgi:uncharacterized protein YbjT (DUF2867 family)